MNNKDTEILNRLEKVFYNSLVSDIPKKKKEFDGTFADGYIQSMDTTARWVLKFIKENREV